MGEAKRRKQLDANFGKRDYVIEVKKVIDGWELFLNDESIDLIDSEEKAIEIKEWLTNQIKINPFPEGRLNKDMITVWLFNNIESLSSTEECAVLEFLRRLKEFSKSNPLSPSDILSIALTTHESLSYKWE